jgi:hypothetical protein
MEDLQTYPNPTCVFGCLQQAKKDEIEEKFCFNLTLFLPSKKYVLMEGNFPALLNHYHKNQLYQKNPV